MNGAIFFSGQHGSTAQYAEWIGEATGLPVFNVNDTDVDPSKYDFLVLGSSVIVYKLTIRKWVHSKLAGIKGKPIILFTVSGARAGSKLDAWIADSLPGSLVATIKHVALGGRMNPKDLSWWLRMVLRIGAWRNKNPEDKKQELEGFDFMDKTGIEPILKLVRQRQSTEATPTQRVA